MNLIERLSWLKTKIQEELFPALEESFTGVFTKKQQQLVSILETIEIERYVSSPVYQWMGRKPKDRQAIARAFVAKAVYNFSTTRDLIEALHSMVNLRKICGYMKKQDIPSESTFSRAFEEFAKNQLGEKVHEALAGEYLREQIIGHISRDATAIEGNEKPAKRDKAVAVKVESKKKGRPKKGEIREDKEDVTRLMRQVGQTPEDAIKGLPTVCDVGCKKNAKGYKETWIGYKLHIDTNDCGLPITAVLTSASLHDSQVAIPMMKITTKRVNYLYDLMDAAYDAKPIYDVSKALGHVPIIDRNPRRGNAVLMTPAEAMRYNERTAAERCNSRLKCEFGGETVMVRGHNKVKLHLMFGIIALFADQLLKLLT